MSSERASSRRGRQVRAAGKTDVRWEWSQQQFFGRNYRVVRGARSGQFWDGERLEESTINPLDYVSLGNKSDSGD